MKFHDSIAKLLTAKLAEYKNARLDRTVCTQIYVAVFQTLQTLIEETKTPLSNEAVNYIAQQYYDGILINDNQELDPEIFTQRATLNAIPTNELALLAMMFEGTDFRIPVIEAIKNRS
jgi:hypothetical protein